MRQEAIDNLLTGYIWSSIPFHMIEGVKMYITHGKPPGGFLSALFSNDFMGAAGRADQTNINYLKNWSLFMHNQMPSRSQGSKEKFDDWIKSGGLIGQSDAAEADLFGEAPDNPQGEETP